MATLLRSLCRQGRSLQCISRTQARVVLVPLKRVEASRSISTSDKKKDVSASVQPMEKSAELKRLTEHFADTDEKKEENWVSYGYEPGDRDMDWFIYHTLMFFIFSIGLCWGGFILAYQPDYQFRDWCQREAFLELERREKEGLPLVDPDYVRADLIELPSDEEIGDTEIII